MDQGNYSPTSSQMKGNFSSEINVITSDKPFINNSFELTKDFREESEHFNWFSQFDRTYHEILIKEWITDMEKHKINFNFEIWLEYYLIKQGIQNPYDQSRINVQTSLYKK